MAELPAKIEVGGYTYTCVEDAAEILRMNAVIGISFGGICEFENARILLNPSPALSRRRVDMAHECCHAIINERHLDTLFKDETDEVFVKVFAPALVELLRRNPGLVAFLVSEAEE